MSLWGRETTADRVHALARSTFFLIYWLEVFWWVGIRGAVASGLVLFAHSVTDVVGNTFYPFRALGLGVALGGATVWFSDIVAHRPGRASPRGRRGALEMRT